MPAGGCLPRRARAAPPPRPRRRYSSTRDQIHGGDGTYSNTTLGVASPFADGTTAASFNGTSSYTQLPSNIINGIGSMSVSMWFKTTATNVPLLSYSQNPITSANAGAFVPILYVGSDGKLNGMFWCNAFCNQIAGSAVVNDGNWHYVVLAGSNTGGGSQTLYLDGNVIGSNTGGVNSNGYPKQYIGAGFLGGMWNDEPWKGYIAAHADQLDEHGHRLVVRNGRAQPRQVLTSAGAVEGVAPRVNDKRVDEATGVG